MWVHFYIKLLRNFRNKLHNSLVFYFHKKNFLKEEKFLKHEEK